MPSRAVTIEGYGGPRRPQSARFIFADAQDTPFATSEAAEAAWIALDPEEREGYEEQASSAMRAYQLEMNVFRGTPKYKEWKEARGGAGDRVAAAAVAAAKRRSRDEGAPAPPSK
eukprot:Hpha_TRINITY_DN7151_c0_g1::TRINITY_DN7151_c0_g1_i1::g.29777::m.29777